MITWMLYAALVGTLIAAGAFAAERLVASQVKPRRFVWLAALTLAVVVPLVGGLREPPSTEVIRAAGPAEPAAPGTARVEDIARFGSPLPSPSSRTSGRTAGIAWIAGSTAALAVLCSVLVAVGYARRRWPRRRVDSTEVYLSRRFGPALVGIVAPKPVIPAWVLRAEPSARTAILRHELEHARARDHLALLYAAIVAAVFPWSPAIWWMCRRLRAAIEMDCDQRVVGGGIATADYGKVLLQAWTRAHGRWGLVPAMGQPKSLLEQRLKAMMEERLRLNVAHGALLAATAFVALGIACDMPAPTELDDAIDEVMAGDQAPGNGEAGTRIRQIDPLVLVDGVPLYIAEPGSSGLSMTSGGSVRAPLWVEEPREDLRQADPGLIGRSLVFAGERIQSVEIIKGSDATAAYGEEAANGVLHFRTRGNETPEGEEITLTADKFISTRGGIAAKNASMNAAGALVFATKPGESILYEWAVGEDRLEGVPEVQTMDNARQPVDRVLGLVNHMLDSPEVLRGAVLFSESGLMGSMTIVRDREG